MTTTQTPQTTQIIGQSPTYPYPEKDWSIYFSKKDAKGNWESTRVGAVLEATRPSIKVVWDDGGGETIMLRDMTGLSGGGVYASSYGRIWLFEPPPLICRCE